MVTPTKNQPGINDYSVRICPKGRRALYQDVPVKAHSVTEAREIATAMYTGMDILQVR